MIKCFFDVLNKMIWSRKDFDKNPRVFLLCITKKVALQAQTQTQFVTQIKPLTYFKQNTLKNIFSAFTGGFGLLANLKPNRWLISNKIHSKKFFSALTGEFGLLTNLKHKHKLQLKPNPWLISNKIPPHIFFSQPYSLNACVYFRQISHTHSYCYSLPGERVRLSILGL